MSLRIAAKFEGPLIDVQLGPVGPQWVSEATLAAVGRHAERATGAPYLRHPSRGGATRFAEGLRLLLA